MEDLDSLIKNLDEALAWLGAVGIRSHTRFNEYRKTLVTVREHRTAGTLPELFRVVPLGHYRFAFIESAQLIVIAKTFERIPGSRFREKIRIAAAGPAHPFDEKKSGSKARDFLFELSVAAYLRSRKLPVLMCSKKDLITRLPACTILIECKRPQSGKKVGRAIKDATNQLKEHFKNYPSGIARYGFIALDISVAMNPQRMFVVGDSVDAISNTVDTLFIRLLKEFNSELTYRRDQRILGVLAFAKVLAYCESQNCHISFQKIQPCIHAPRGSYGSMLAEELCNRFSPGVLPKPF